MARKRNKQQDAPDQSGGDQAEHGMLNAMDKEGNPAGGYFRCTGIDISWQNGPLGRGDDRKEPNGAFVEDVIEAAIARLDFYQATRFACRENGHALQSLREAKRWLAKRTERREAAGVEGTHEGR